MNTLPPAKIFAIFVLILFLTGCDSSDQDDLTRYINEVKLRKPAPIEPLPEFSPIETYVYPANPASRNPFKPKVHDTGADKYAPDTHRQKQPLERFPLDALRFVGVLKQGGTIWGLISQPGGIISRVSVGDYMGQNFGRIVSISNSSLKLEERVQSSGTWDIKITTFNLSTKD